MPRFLVLIFILNAGVIVSYADTPDSNRVNAMLDRLKKHNSVHSFSHVQSTYYITRLSGAFKPSNPDSGRPIIVLNFLQEYLELFGLDSIHNSIRFGEHGEDFGADFDSVEDASGFRYYMQQWYNGIPVSGTRIEVYFDRRKGCITSMNTSLLADIAVNCSPSFDEQAIQKVIAGWLNRPNRHCSVSDIRLNILRKDQKDHLAWWLSLTCRPDQGFAWGEEAWVDAHSGEVLNSYSTWIE